MRILFAGLASAGHTYPMVPLAIAARDLGHEVHFAAGEHVHAPLRRLGLNPFRPADSFYEIYAEDLEPDLKRLRPDLVVHGWGVPEAAIAARRAGIPALWHGFGRMFPRDIGFERPTGGVHLDICPPSLQEPDFLATADRIALRPVPFAEPGGFRGPLVYLTLGTAFGTPELLKTAIDGLATLGTPVVVATGRVTPEDLGPLPEQVTAQAWVPQAAALAHADLVVHHGGSGTALGALAAGVPQLVLPQGADQFANAEALLAVGAAVRLLPGELSAEAVAEQARKAFSCRDAARAIAEEIAAMPSPDEVARDLPKQAK
ncbi:glycosyl transferase [Amycolatopsis mediterranei S699]|uniref:Glycosyl transferase n=2 Tax=Amycolatopsis mediterranei TaxID=33910 RepID=A0A9R0P6S7_AMYMS|nr:glycosyltransferase [Amycolatopsis mediterranei]ADJ50396.1 putative glycosyltransferase [Amycolatopsis mediterranei U32]AEK47397.1 glycosyl transferase [Amycolatopsis mediterranei S699]AFO82102.1 glycosyl transferase [Amycolatopsis mediterranei S699]AGT89231.1 glycosyl transferase [Amycolatopsis mediterranei RB]KDO08218.1 glycosyl transferase [Amycolatopsis mediterranei]